MWHAKLTVASCAIPPRGVALAPHPAEVCPGPPRQRRPPQIRRGRDVRPFHRHVSESGLAGHRA